MTAVEHGTRRAPLRQYNTRTYQGDINCHKHDSINELADWRDYCSTKNQSQTAVIRELNKDCDISKKYVAMTKKSTNKSSFRSECSKKHDSSDILSVYKKGNSLWSAMNSDNW